MRGLFRAAAALGLALIGRGRAAPPEPKEEAQPSGGASAEVAFHVPGMS
jgi:hypothetical protein